MPAWLKATLIFGGVILGAFLVIQFAVMVVGARSRRASAPPAPPPVVAPAPTPAPATQRGSELFSFDAPPPGKETPPTVAPAPPPTVPPPPVATAPATTPAPALRYRPVPVEQAKKEIVTDEAINAAIVKGVNFLISRFEDGKLKDAATVGDRYVGMDALCVLALLHAGEAVSGDERLNPNNAWMLRALDQLRDMELPPTLKTYTVSLRVQALAFANRKADHSRVVSDTRWLVTNGVKGAYAYVEPPAGATQPSAVSWDNSNSQYGALGAWAAAEAGLTIPPSYWMDVQRHWESSQLKSGGWSYNLGGEGSLSMTAAGINMLFVANEMVASLRSDTQVARPPFSPSLQAGLDWLGKGDNAVNLASTSFVTYTLYGMERAGLASGFKMFGKHDWFRELARGVLTTQAENGTWGNGEIDTAFTVLFLSRGRHPLMMNKLHYVGAWANRPRDAARLTKFTSRETERPLNWQVVSLSSDWQDWLDAPILYLSSHEAPIFDDSDFEKLKSFCMAGGLLFTHADGDSKEFNQWAELLAMRLFPDQQLADLPENHFIYSAGFRPRDKFPLRAVGNATRLYMVHSPTDIAKRWQAKDPKADRSPFELGANLFVYATGMHVPRNRVATLAAPEVRGNPKDLIVVARLKHAGDWNPEPWAWVRMSRLFRAQTSIGLTVAEMEIEKLAVDIAPIAHLTSTAAFSLNDAQLAALQKYVDTGGVLIIDPCGGFRPTAESIRTNILARAFPGKETAILSTDHPLIAGRGEGLQQIAKAQVRPYVLSTLGQNFSRPMILESGKGAVIVSDLDLTSGLLGSNTLGILGYDPDYAYVLVKNAILWTVNGR